MMNQTFADILLPLPLADKYTYLIPEHLTTKCNIGSRVLIQFGKKKIYTGLIFEIHNNKPTNFETKEIIEVLDSTPIINNFQKRIWTWCANYYMCPKGDFYKAALPAGLRLESETKIIPVPDFPDIQKLHEKARMIYYALENQNTLTINEIGKVTAPTNPVTIIKTLLDNKAVLIQEQVKSGYKAKTEKRIRLHESITTEEQLNLILDSLKNAKKQQQFLSLYIDSLPSNIFDKNGISKQPFIKEHNFTNAVIKGVAEKNIIEEFSEDISRLSKDEETEITPAHKLNEHQQKAYDSIIEQFKEKDTVLLHGVTSSGKTELYIHLIEKTINEGRQILYLLPEIALTSQIIQRLRKVFGNKIGVYHSKFSDAERVEIYRNLLQNDKNSYQIILGVRSSVFLPFSNLGLVIVDEEHENTYKQFDPSPRYNARDMAVVLSLMHKGNTLLGSATPSIESYYNAKNNRYGLAELHQRFKNVQLPEIEIADTLKAKKKKQMVSHFSPQLISQIDAALANNEQVILFQNRRGFSPFIECNSCGWIPKCTACDVSLTYHKGINKLVCHYCGYSIKNIIHCPQCKQADIETKGFGTEKIEDEISLIFRDAKIGRLDLDTAKGKHGHEKIINDFQNQKLDILIGTQMVSKGLDFDHVKVVGILNADSMLGYPDFRAFERSYQLMSQVSGRAGRRDKQGTVVIQTYDPEHKIITQVKHNRFDLMYDQQLAERRQFFYPPFSRLIKVVMRHRQKDTLNAASKNFAESIKPLPNTKILGPTTPVIMRVQNFYIKHIMIKLSRTQDLTDLKQEIRQKAIELNKMDNFKSVQVVFDVDPM